MRFAFPRRSRRNLAAVAFVLAAAFAAFWLFRPRDEVTPLFAAGPHALVYETTGFEEVDVLGGARHVYPARTSIVVRRSGGCTTYHWQPFEERIYEWELCGDRLRRFSERHKFFGNDDRRTYLCEPGSSLLQGWRCTSPKTTETARVVASRPGYARLRTTLRGESKGSGTREFWLRPDGTPERMVVANRNTTPSIVGDVHYREQYELRLSGSSRG